MCTLIALHRCISGAPLLIAANRDEFHDRPAQPPALRSGAGGLVLAPRDDQAGGTWLGLNEQGLFAALTNRPCPEPDRERRSRGLLVMDALSEASAEEAAKRLSVLPDRAYNPFNLFVSDRDSAWLVTYGDGARALALGPGAHVIGNADPSAPPTPKLERLRREVAEAASKPADEVIGALAEICCSHEGEDPLRATCVHAGHYGTRSSTLLALAEPGSESVFHFAEGAPCSTPYEDFTPLLHELGQGSQRVGGEPMRIVR